MASKKAKILTMSSNGLGLLLGGGGMFIGGDSLGGWTCSIRLGLDMKRSKGLKAIMPASRAKSNAK
ncbi:hypothetical protein D3C85_1350610 [compost metagenome]